MLNNLLNGVIRFSLHQRVLVVVLACTLIVYGGWQVVQLPIDVFPSLDRPRVVIMTEAHGMAPEEVETLITFPLESALNGASGVQAVRTVSGVGLSVVYVEFDWGTDINIDRQVVTERMALVSERLPPEVTPQLAPISSIMGQIMMIGIWSEDGSTSPMDLRTMADWNVRQRLLTIPGVSQVFVMGGGRKQYQVLVNPEAMLQFGVTMHEVETALDQSNENSTGGYLDQQGPRELLVRSLGRIQSIDELKEVVITMRDGRPVLVGQVARVIEGPQVKRGDSSAYIRDDDGHFIGGPAIVLTINKQPDADTRKVTAEITAALEKLEDSLPDDVRISSSLYQQKTFIDLAIANVVEALTDGSMLVVIILFLFLLNFRTTFITLTAIPLSITITMLVFAAFGLSINTMTLGGLAVAIGELVDDAIVDVENIYRRLKLNRALEKPKPLLRVVFEASAEIRNSIVFGSLIVVLVFIPVFALSGMEGRLFTPLGIAYIVSILSSLVVSLTLTPVLSYWLLAKGRMWSIIAGLISAGAAWVLSFWVIHGMLDRVGFVHAAEWWAGMSTRGHLQATAIMGSIFWLVMMWADRFSERNREGLLLRAMKTIAGWMIRVSLRVPFVVLSASMIVVAISMAALLGMENDFLPPFDEGSVQINVILPPGTSLTKSKEVGRIVEERLQKIEDFKTLVRKTGRAELDEHAVPVSASEFIATLDPESPRTREETLYEIREALADVKGPVYSVDQPLAHLISHMLSGVQAQVAIKLYGDNLRVLHRRAQEIKTAIEGVEGVTDLQVEPQIEIPQLKIEIDGHKLKQYGLRRAAVTEFVQTAMNGHTVSEIIIGQRKFDLIVRLDEAFREDIDAVERLSIPLPGGGSTTLKSLTKIDPDSSGPNTINREQVQRRIVIQCNTQGRGLVDVVQDIKARVKPIEQSIAAEHSGYFVEYGGQFESQRSASRKISFYFLGAIVGMYLVLYTMFRSSNLSLQVMIALPMALIGSVAALYLTGQTLTIAAMIGFISLCGIASRNGILLINHYLHLVEHEGETWSREMIIRAGQERVAPVLMTALTSGIGLVPLALAAGEPGKEILFPVATVIIGGLVTSTLLEFLVRPALFWKFGIGSAQRAIEQDDQPLVRQHDD